MPFPASGFIISRIFILEPPHDSGQGVFTMKTLPVEFVSKKFAHRQLKRAGDVVLFTRHRLASSGIAEQGEHFEVIRVRKDPDRTIAGVLIPAHEAYPGAEQWGVAGFTYSGDDRAGAERRFAEMSQ